MKLEILEISWKKGGMRRFLDAAGSPAWVGDTFIKDTWITRRIYQRSNDKTPPYLDKKSGERKKKEEEREKTLPLSRLTYRILIIRLVITPLSRLNDQRASRKREGDLDKGIEGYRNRVREWIYGVGSLARSFERIAPSLSLSRFQPGIISAL